MTSRRPLAPDFEGSKPPDLPARQPAEFEFDVQRRTAKALDVSVAELLRRSTEGIYGDGSEQELAVLASDLLNSARESRAALRAALSETQATLKQLRQRRRERRVA